MANKGWHRHVGIWMDGQNPYKCIQNYKLYALGCIHLPNWKWLGQDRKQALKLQNAWDL